MKRVKLVLAAGLALCATGWAQEANTASGGVRRQPPKPPKHKTQHQVVSPRSDREKQERALLKAEQRRQNRLEKKQRRDARRNTKRRSIIQ